MNVWDEVLTRIESKVNRHSFHTWFKPTSFCGQNTGTVIVRVPNLQFKDWLLKHYSGVIGEAMRDLKKGDLMVRFVTESIGDAAAAPPTTEETGAFEVSEIPRPGGPGAVGLNPRYTFDTFIV